jgi:hypothetical protein
VTWFHLRTGGFLVLNFGNSGNFGSYGNPEKGLRRLAQPL